MTEQERQQVLKMIEQGTISPEEGLKLMRTLDQSRAEDETPVSSPAVTQAPAAAVSGNSFNQDEQENTPAGSRFEDDPRILRIKEIVARLWQIPLWIGVAFTLLSAWGMYALIMASRINFWFFCLFLALLMGVLLIVAGIGSRRARWLFVDVRQKPGSKPARIFLGFPIPLRLAAWLLRTIGRFVPEVRKSKVDFDAMLLVIETGIDSDHQCVVNVDEGEMGDRVRVYIG
jgi:hypothetical protein